MRIISLMIMCALAWAPWVRAEGEAPTSMPVATPAKATPPQSESSLWAWITLGVGGALLFTAGGVQLSAMARRDDADAEADPDRKADLQETADEREQEAVFMALGGGALVVIGGVRLLWDEPSEPTVPAKTSQIRVVPTGLGLSFQGSF